MRGRSEVDTFPTRYLANSRGTVYKLAAAAGLEVAAIERIESRPEYLRMTWVTYLPGILYERLVNSMNLLSGLRILLMGQLRKPEK